MILHFFDKKPYPILDYRALWLLRVEEPRGGFGRLHYGKFWIEYTDCCRRLVFMKKVFMRTLDKALWQHSWEGK